MCSFRGEAGGLRLLSPIARVSHPRINKEIRVIVLINVSIFVIPFADCLSATEIWLYAG